MVLSIFASSKRAPAPKIDSIWGGNTMISRQKAEINRRAFIEEVSRKSQAEWKNSPVVPAIYASLATKTAANADIWRNPYDNDNRHFEHNLDQVPQIIYQDYASAVVKARATRVKFDGMVSSGRMPKIPGKNTTKEERMIRRDLARDVEAAEQLGMLMESFGLERPPVGPNGLRGKPAFKLRAGATVNTTTPDVQGRFTGKIKTLGRSLDPRVYKMSRPLAMAPPSPPSAKTPTVTMKRQPTAPAKATAKATTAATVTMKPGKSVAPPSTNTLTASRRPYRRGRGSGTSAGAGATRVNLTYKP